MKLVGKVKDAQGLRGEFYVLVFSGEISWSAKLTHFQLRNEAGESHDFKVKKIRPNKKGIVLSCEEISDRTQAEKWIGFQFLIPENLLVSKKGEAIYLGEILNFSLLGEKEEVLGMISGFSSNGVQDLLIVKNDKGEHMVPFVSPWIMDLDFEKRTVQMNLPAGLLGDE